MTPIRILMGNEPQSYQTAHAETFRTLRPTAEIHRIEPAELDDAVVRLAPHLVVCSRLTPVVETRPLSWILLYPDGANLAVVSIAGKVRVIHKVDLDDLFSTIDEVQQRICAEVLPRPATTA